MTILQSWAVCWCLAAPMALCGATDFGSAFGRASMGAAALDAAGNIYIAGSTTQASIPLTSGAFQQTFIHLYAVTFRDRMGAQARRSPVSMAL